MKLFTTELVNDYLKNTTYFDDIDKFFEFTNTIIGYLNAIDHDRRFETLYKEIEEEDQETLGQFIEMTNRAHQFSDMLKRELKKFDKEKTKIIDLSHFESTYHLPLHFIRRKIIRKTTSRFINLQIYWTFYKKHFEQFKKSLIYKKSGFREWEDIDDDTSLYNVLPLFDEKSAKSAAFYGSVRFAVGWSFYCRMFRAKEFLELYNLTIQDMKENDIYYIAKALGASISGEDTDSDLTGLLSRKTRESEERMKTIKPINFTLSYQYKKETGLTPEMLTEQNLFEKNETQEQIDSLRAMINDASKNGNAVMVDLNNGSKPTRIIISFNDLPDEIKEQAKKK